MIDIIFNLKREIKGRIEDLSPWLALVGFYNNGKYETYMDKIQLSKSHTYKVITKEIETKDNEGRTVREIEHEIIERDAPKFAIDIDPNYATIVESKDSILSEIENFLKNNDKNSDEKNNKSGIRILVYKRKFIETQPEFGLYESNSSK